MIPGIFVRSKAVKISEPNGDASNKACFLSRKGDHPRGTWRCFRAWAEGGSEVRMPSGSRSRWNTAYVLRLEQGQKRNQLNVGEFMKAEWLLRERYPKVTTIIEFLCIKEAKHLAGSYGQSPFSHCHILGDKALSSHIPEASSQLLIKNKIKTGDWFAFLWRWCR